MRDSTGETAAGAGPVGELVHVPAQRLDQLFDEARMFTDKNHSRFLAEVLENLARTEDPIGTVKLLIGMFRSGFASRPNERASLNAVGLWLEQRLGIDPGIEVRMLSAEVGWLRRLSRYHEKAGSAERGGDARGGAMGGGDSPGGDARTGSGRVGDARGGAGWAGGRSGGPGRDDGLKFGDKIDAIEQRRKSLLTARAEAARTRVVVAPGESSTAVEGARPKSEGPAPVEVPSVLEVRLADVKAARETRKARRDREKAGKAPKEAFVSLTPVRIELQPMLRGLACSSLNPGLELVFQAMEKAGGGLVPFWVGGLVERDQRRVAETVTLERPADG